MNPAGFRPRGWPYLGLVGPVLFLTFLLIVPNALPTSLAQPAPPHGPFAIPRTTEPKGDPGTAALQAATASLAAGQGPAGGADWNCDLTASQVGCTTNGLGSSAVSHAGYLAAAGARARGVPGIPLMGPIAPAAAPAGRINPAVTLFENGSKFGVLLFGGVDPSGVNGTYLGDTWQFNPGDHTWWNVTSRVGCPAGCPSARWGASAAYDYADGYAVLFGGCHNSTQEWMAATASELCAGRQVLGDGWAYSDPIGGAGVWSPIVANPAPAPRFGAGLAYDGVDGYLVLFGGCGLNRCPLPDTWSYLAGQWTHLLANFQGIGQPTARFGAAMGEEGSNGPVVLFGGCSSGAPACDNGQTLLQDTWVFFANSWTEFQTSANCTAAAPCPTPRYDASSTMYDGPGLAGAFLLYGGLGPNGHVLGSSDDGGGGWWSYGGSPQHWTEYPAPPGWSSAEDGWLGTTSLTEIGGAWGEASPPPDRFGAAIAGTPYNGLLLFGGATASGSLLTDTWAANYLSAPPQYVAYSGRVAPQVDPPAVTSGAAAFDAADGSGLFVGGCTSECPNASTWSLAPYNPASRLEPWQAVVPPPGASIPSARYGESLTYDPSAGGAVLLFGGQTSMGSYLNDLWEYGHGRWTELSEQGPIPPVRSFAGFAYDGGTGTAVLFGGENSSGFLGDTWQLAFLPTTASWTWYRAATTGRTPADRYAPGLAYDASDNELVLFGGCGNTCAMGDTWTFQSNAWQLCTTASCASGGPSARWGELLDFDPLVGRVVLFGGCASTCPMNDTWEFVNGNWTKFSSTGAVPPARLESEFEYDPNFGGIVVRGGTGAGATILGGAGWLFTVNGWSSMGAAAPVAPALGFTGRFGATAVYDSGAKVVLLIGGCGGTTISGACNGLTFGTGTWAFGQNDTWQLLCSPCGPRPRWDSAAAYDGRADVTVVFGGCFDFLGGDGRCSSPLNETWELNYSAGRAKWTQISTTPTPPARSDAAMAFVPNRPFGATVMYGGWGGKVVLNDTWEFNASAGAWTNITPLQCGSVQQCIPGLAGAGGVYDPQLGAMVVYGGEGNVSGGVSNELWFLPAPRSPWVQQPPNPLFSPIAVYDAGVAFDVNRQALVVYGGILSGGAISNVTMVLYANGLLDLYSSPASGPGARFGTAFAFDPSGGPRGIDLLIGGASGYALGGAGPRAYPGGSGLGQGDTWGLSWGGGGWTDLTPFT